MRPKCPCKGCEDRTPTCHAQCPDGKYDKWKAVLAEEMKARQKENDSYSKPKRTKDNTRMRLGIKQWNGKVR